MRIALIDTTKRPSVYPVALLKIGAWRRAEGDECSLFINSLPAEADEIWVSTCFTYDIPHALGIIKEATNRAGVVRVGGVAATLMPEYFERLGVVVHRGLVPEAEQSRPDYRLLSRLPKYSVTHTSRGCIRKCKFCMVPRLEPEFIGRDWLGDLHPEAKQILFYDNNWLAKDYQDLCQDVDQIRGLVQAGRIKQIDFNQALDCRLLTEEKADLLEGLPLFPVRFAFDGMQEDGYYQDAIRMMVARGFTFFISYVLYNFTDTPQDFYYRLRTSIELQEELGVHKVSSYPMRYQPILTLDRGHVGKHWSMRKRQGFKIIKSAHTGYRDLVSPNSIEEFEYFYGASADEFDHLLAYPKLRQLMRCKKGAIRMERLSNREKEHDKTTG